MDKTQASFAIYGITVSHFIQAPPVKAQLFIPLKMYVNLREELPW